MAPIKDSVLKLKLSFCASKVHVMFYLLNEVFLDVSPSDDWVIDSLSTSLINYLIG